MTGLLTRYSWASLINIRETLWRYGKAALIWLPPSLMIFSGLSGYAVAHESERADPDRRYRAEYQQQVRRESVTMWYFSGSAELTMPDNVLTRPPEAGDKKRAMWLGRAGAVAAHEVKEGVNVVFRRKYVTGLKEQFSQYTNYISRVLSVQLPGGESEGTYAVGLPGSGAPALAVWSSWRGSSLCMAYAASGTVAVKRHPLPARANTDVIDTLNDSEDRRRYETLAVNLHLRFETVVSNVKGILPVGADIDETCIPHGSRVSDGFMTLEGREEYFWRPLVCYPTDSGASSCWIEEPKNL